MIIGLAGQKKSGKDTVAAYLVKQYQFERKAFADPLKRSVAALLDIPFHEVDQHKNDPTVYVALGYINNPNQDPRIDADEWIRKSIPTQMWSPIVTPQTFRSFLQRYGTESHREVFGQDFWVDMTLPLDGYYPGRKMVVTDCRFPNEAKRVSDLGGMIVEVIRPGSEVDPHPSEQYDFPKDYLLHNDGTLDDLWPKIEAMLDWAAEQNDT